MKKILLLSAVWLLANQASAQISVPVVIDTQLKYSTFCSLMRLTGYYESLEATEDKEYRDMYRDGVHNFFGAVEQGGFYYQRALGDGSAAAIPPTRKFAFTAFVEPNSVYEGIGVNGVDEKSLGALKKYLADTGSFPNASADGDYKNPQNIINQFVGYHLLPERLERNSMVVHYNEQGYAPFSTTRTLGIPVSEWYETLSAGRQLLKLSEGYGTEGIRLNRFWQTNNDATSVDNFVAEIHDEGLPLMENEMVADNGIIYQLDKILTCSLSTIDRMASERMRFDMASLLPEMMNNGLRRPLSNYSFGRNLGFSVRNTKDIQYFENLRSLNGESRISYLPGTASNWGNVQGDEFCIEGSFDILLKLPSVPATGIYEIRMGMSANSLRGLGMFYFGTEPDRLSELRLPIDLRTGGVNLYASRTKPSYLGWEEDIDDAVCNRLTDMALRAKGYMKAPASYLLSPSSSFSARGSLREVNYSGDRLLRIIITEQEMKAGETYYLRIKDALGKDNAQLYLDYIELCPESVYANPERGEDKW